MKKLLALLLSLAMTLSLAACGGSNETTTTEESGSGDAAGETYSFSVGTNTAEDSVNHLLAAKFKELIEERSEGAVTVTLYENGALGGDAELTESCIAGSVDFIVGMTGSLVNYIPEAALFDLPNVFPDLATAREVLDGPILAELQAAYEAGGLKLFGYADSGFRVMTSSEPFTGMESFKGQKIRTMENTYHIQFWNAVGASPTPMTFSEVYIGLQQGTIDAQENAYELIVSAKLYEQQEVLVQTNAVPDYITLIVSDDFFRDLDKEQQQIVREAAAIAQEKARESADERREQREEELAAEGMEIVEIDQQTWEEMQEACQPVYENIRKQAGDELVDLYMGVE